MTEQSQFAGGDFNHDYVHTNGDVQGDGVGGSGEELAQTLEKVVSQLDIISRTLHVLEQRVSMNEESVNNVMGYFNELRAQKENHNAQQVNQTHLGYNASQGNVINAMGAASNYNQSGHLSFN